jgi:hypothetical protein
MTAKQPQPAPEVEDDRPQRAHGLQEAKQLAQLLQGGGRLGVLGQGVACKVTSHMHTT